MSQNEYKINSIPEELNYLGALSLIMAIFRLTAQDLKYGNKEIKQEAQIFLRSVWFKSLCDGINMDSFHVGNVIKGSNRISTRVGYE